MALIIIYISIWAASVFGIAAMAYLGDEFLTSKFVDPILMLIALVGIGSALLYEFGRWYLAYQHRHYPVSEGYVDHGALLFHQSMVVLAFLIAYFTNSIYLVMSQIVVFIFTVASLELSPYVVVYRLVIQPLNMVKRDLRQDNMRAHKFAFYIGLIVSLLASFALVNDMVFVGWAMVWLIIVLGSIAVVGWCAGCYSYYILNKIGFNGYFSDCPVNNGRPGIRPARKYKQVSLIKANSEQ